MRFTSTVTVSIFVGACSAIALSCGTDDSCEGTSSCGTSGTGGGGGTAGTGGGGGAGGTSGTGGTGNMGGTSGTGGAGGVSGSGGTAGTDAGQCDTTKTPSQEACLVDDQHAVFVNGTVATTGTGTKASPFKTITEALGAASGKLILVCDNTYDEQVKITAGVKLFGGFSCTTWSFETGKRAVVKPTAKGNALSIDSVSSAVLIEDMEFTSADGTLAGESSVSAMVNASTDVKLHRVKLAAGKGVAGANGVLAPFTFPKTQTQLNGNPANVLAGGALNQCSCPAGDQSIGGFGGNAPTPSKGGDGLPALGGGQGGTPGSCGSGATGKDGTAPSAAADAPGAGTLGALIGAAWSPTKGANATPGGPGQGGGGGASSATGGGGGGGCGGCGGAGGPGGGGGGASIALLAINSTVSIDAGSELLAADGGNGGNGVAGQSGQTEYGFGANPGPGGCLGGAGAPGGAGGAGGGGAGGISVSVLWKGTAAPTIDGSAKLTFGKKGTKGTGGKAGSNDGIDGVAQNVLQAN
ncbi:MAG: hypothetical protein IPM35_17945 [Myxococcales bacterium]|nr:hypothetical protein [Myxococcales bacterium]